MGDIPPRDELNRPELAGGSNSDKVGPMEHKKPYSPEFCERSVRLFFEHRLDWTSERAALAEIAGKLGCSSDSFGSWSRE